MKAFTLLFTLLFMTTAYAAQVSWIVNGLDGAYANGSSYLLDLNGATADSGIVGKIANYIAEKGLTRAPTSDLNVTDFDSSPIAVDGDYVYIMGNREGLTYNVDYTDVSTYCVLILDQNKEKFFLTNIQSLAIEPKDKNGSVSWNDDWEDGYWTLHGAVSGTVGAVPEPTVLALLALGVAGIALKRKKVVA